MKSYHDIVIAGIALFESPKGMKRSFDQWVASVTDWLHRSGCDQAIVFEWFSLNLVDTDDKSDISELEEKLLIYLNKVTDRYKWLARNPNKGKLPSETKLRAALRQTIKSLGQKNADMLSMGVNGLEVKDFNQAHTNFILWLRTIADKLNELSPGSGFDAEWLSLPVMTFKLDNSEIGGRRLYYYMVDAVADRVRWLCKLLGVDTKKYISQLAKIKEKPRQLEALLDIFMSDVPIPNSPAISTPVTPLLQELSGKEWLTLEELALYTGYAKKTLYNWTSAGKLPSSKPYGKLLFKRIEVDNWLIKNSGYLRKGYKKGNTSPNTGEK